jgi:hypothetical protein
MNWRFAEDSPCWRGLCRDPFSMTAATSFAAESAVAAEAVGLGAATATAGAAGATMLTPVATGSLFGSFALPSLSSVALGLSALGAVMTASSLYEQGQAGARSAEYNAALMRRNAEIARQQTQLDLEQHQRDRVRQFGAIRAAVGASGVALEGSPLDILESAAIEAERDKQMIEYKGSLRAMGYYDNAAIERIAGSAAATRGVSSATAALLSGGGTVAKQGYELKV